MTQTQLSRIDIIGVQGEGRGVKIRQVSAVDRRVCSLVQSVDMCVGGMSDR